MKEDHPRNSKKKVPYTIATYKTGNAQRQKKNTRDIKEIKEKKKK